MNIFILSNIHHLNARYHSDIHVGKMLLEGTQLLCTALWRCNYSDILPIKFKSKLELYKPSYVNHPCNIWATQSKSNFLWLIDHCKALSDEFTFRSCKIHKSNGVLIRIQKYKIRLKDIGLTRFALAMPEQYKTNSAVSSYRAYYKNDKTGYWKQGKWYPATWKNRPVPSWFN